MSASQRSIFPLMLNKYGWLWLSLRLVARIPQTSLISHNAPFCNINMHMSVNFCYRMVHCGIFFYCIVGFMRWVQCHFVDHKLVEGGLVTFQIRPHDWTDNMPVWHRVPFRPNHSELEAIEAIPDSKVHGANMGPTWVLSAPDGPHVGPLNLVIRDVIGLPSWWTPKVELKYHEALVNICLPNGTQYKSLLQSWSYVTAVNQLSDQDWGNCGEVWSSLSMH